MEANPSYADGLRDGKIQAIEEMQARQNIRLDDHSARLRVLERVAWILVGVIGFIQIWPTLERIVS